MTTWQLIKQEDPGEPFGDSKSLNGQPYPSWWVSPFKYLNQNLLEGLYGFPYLSWWYLEENGFLKFPKIDLNTFKAPTHALFVSMSTLDNFGKLWREKSTKRDGDQSWMIDLCNFWDSDPKASHYKLWESYLVENCIPQLQFFGVPFKTINNEKIFKSDSLFFKKPLSYCPGKWTLMVVFSLMILIVHKIKNEHDAPFLSWPAIDQTDPLRAEKTLWLSDRSQFEFPILNWLRTKDEPQIMKFAQKIRGYRSPTLAIPNYNEEIGQRLKMSVLFCFIKFYQEDGFTKYEEKDLYFGFAGPFRWLYGNMISEMKKDPILSASLRNIDGPGGIYRNPFSNLKSSTDWMLWSLIIMWIDLKDAGIFQSDQKILVNEDHYRGAILQPFNAFKQRTQEEEHNKDFNQKEKEKWENRSSDGQPPRPLIGSPFPTGRLLNQFLIDFQYAWRKTAQYKFLGIDEQVWPPPFPSIPFEDSNSLDAKIYHFITQNPPRRLKVPAVDNILFQRQSWKWEAVYVQQYTWYLEWVYYNVKAQQNGQYSTPGTQLKTPEGEYIKIEENGSSLPIMNTFPDLIMVPPSSGLTLSKVVSFLIIPVDQAAKFIWGDDWTDFLDNLGKKIWEKVKEALQKLWVFIKENLPDGFGKYLLLGLAGVGVIFGGWTFVDEEIRKLAR
jgi:hypothetical protein